MSHPNVFLVSADGLRYDRLSHSGNDEPTTPRLDDMAAKGAVCRNAIATGTGTRTSFPGILTSSYPLMYGGYAQMTDHRVPISTVFRDRGYVTLGVNTNAQLHTRFGWDRGYDVYHDSEQLTLNTHIGAFEPAGDGGEGGTGDAHDGGPVVDRKVETLKSEVYRRLDHDSLLYRTLESAYRTVSGREPPHDRAEAAVDRLLSFLDRAPDGDPVFVWIHFMETHSPYVPPAEYRERFLDADISTGRIWEINDSLHTEPETLTDREVAIISDLYDASLRYLDDQIARLFDGLVERGLWDESVVAFTADHGEQFREHDEMTHCSEPWEEGVHVPLLFRVGDEDLTNIERVASTIDIAPTLLDFAFDDPNPPTEYHGLSLRPILRGEESIPEDRIVFSQDASQEGRNLDLGNRITGCRSRNWKYITSVEPAVTDKLFYLSDDPAEQSNVASEYPDVVAEFSERVQRHYELDAYADYSIVDAVDTGQVSQRLQALGYLDE